MREIFLRNGINLTEKQEKSFEIYYELLLEYNQKFNLTAITEREDVIVKHFIDSCYPQGYFSKNASIVDVGSGAGFPAIPLKILREDFKITMVDSLNKRVEFLKVVCEKLGFEDVTCIHARAEDFCKNNREKFDYAVARGVSQLNTLLEYCLPLVKLRGQLVAYKSESVHIEIDNAKNALKVLGGKVNKVDEFILDEKYKRSFVVVDKERYTPGIYPRIQNKAKKSPL